MCNDFYTSSSTICGYLDVKIIICNLFLTYCHVEKLKLSQKYEKFFIFHFYFCHYIQPNFCQSKGERTVFFAFDWLKFGILPKNAVLFKYKLSTPISRDSHN